MRWVKRSSCIWVNDQGDEIVKYRMAGKFYFLCYRSGYRECADYKTMSSLKLAKEYFEKNNQP